MLEGNDAIELWRMCLINMVRAIVNPLKLDRYLQILQRCQSAEDTGTQGSNIVIIQIQFLKRCKPVEYSVAKALHILEAD